MYKILKKTNLYNNHISLGAKMIIYNNYHMPLQYTSSLKEHIAVREKSGIFDISHMGKLIIKGEHSKELIQYLTTNNIDKIKSGKAQYTCLVNENGGIIDDLVIYKISEKKFLLIVNSYNTNKNKKWINSYINKYNNNDVKLLDLSDKYSLLSVQGPMSLFFVQKLTNISLYKIKFYSFIISNLCDINNVLISKTGYTGSVGIEILVKNEYVEKIWNKILFIGRNNIIPCGLSSRDSLRIEMGYRLYGQDLSENKSPIESGLSCIVDFKKPNFLSKKILKKHKKNGLYKNFISFKVKGNNIPRTGNSLVNSKGKKIGYVTSGNYSPILKYCIGLGYLFNYKIDKTDINDIKFNYYNKDIYILSRKKKILITKEKIPFIKINN